MKLVSAALAGLLLCSCAAVQTKPQDAVAVGAYATADAIDAGRFDLADKYIHSVIRLLAPPKKRVPIQPIDK
jgi:hypothetical protein